MASAGIEEELATIKLEKAVARVLADESNGDNFHLVLPALMLTQTSTEGRLHPTVRSMLLENVHNAAAQAYVQFVLRADYYWARPGSRYAQELEAFIIEFWIAPMEDVTHERRGKLTSILGHKLQLTKKRMPKAPDGRPDDVDIVDAIELDGEAS